MIHLMVDAFGDQAENILKYVTHSSVKQRARARARDAGRLSATTGSCELDERFFVTAKILPARQAWSRR